jgi:hypothetical protein
MQQTATHHPTGWNSLSARVRLAVALPNNPSRAQERRAHWEQSTVDPSKSIGFPWGESRHSSKTRTK